MLSRRLFLTKILNVVYLVILNLIVVIIDVVNVRSLDYRYLSIWACGGISLRLDGTLIWKSILLRSSTSSVHIK